MKRVHFIFKLKAQLYLTATRKHCARSEQHLNILLQSVINNSAICLCILALNVVIVKIKGTQKLLRNSSGNRKEATWCQDRHRPTPSYGKYSKWRIYSIYHKRFNEVKSFLTSVFPAVCRELDFSIYMFDCLTNTSNILGLSFMWNGGECG